MRLIAAPPLLLPSGRWRRSTRTIRRIRGCGLHLAKIDVLTCPGMRALSDDAQVSQLTCSNAHSTRSSPTAPPHGGPSAGASNASSSGHGGRSNIVGPSGDLHDEPEYTTGRQPTFADLEGTSTEADEGDDEYIKDYEGLEEGEGHVGYEQEDELRDGAENEVGGAADTQQEPAAEATHAEEGEIIAATASNPPASASAASMQPPTAEHELYDLEDADEPLRFE